MTTATAPAPVDNLKTQYINTLRDQSIKTVAERMELRQKRMESDSQRLSFEATAREIIRYARPDLDTFLDETQQKGKWRGGYMYTSKPMSDLEQAADAFCGNVFSPRGWLGD